MRPNAHPCPRGARLAALVSSFSLLSLIACGREAPPPATAAGPAAIRLAAERPLPDVGFEGNIPAASPAQAGDRVLARTVAALPTRTTVPSRPSIPDPAASAREGAGATPRLTGRSAEGKEVVDFPLVHTRVLAQVSGDVARVEVTQYYANPSKDRLEAVYTFPLPPNAAVTDMLFRIGSRVVLSEVHRREEAKQVYERAKQEGRAAALTEQERPNLFTQSVANVPPGETVAVVLRYVHEVPFDDGRYLFHFPTTVGPRYVPGEPVQGAGGPGRSPDTDRVPDASRVTPPLALPGERSGHDVDILVRLVPGAAFDDVAARSHRVETGLDGDGARLVALAEDDRVPNKDFVLSWRAAGAAPTAHALVQRERGEDFLLLFLQPPAEVAPALVRPKELVFLLDKSGSMSGAPIERAKSLITRALDASGPDDTFQIVAFDGAAQSMTAAPVPVTAENVARAKAWLSLLSGGGGTEMLEGIKAALAPAGDPRRLRLVVFCTDGFIGNEAEIIEAVGALRGSARVFGFGIGTSVNRYLVEGVGRAGRGASEVVDLEEPPEQAVARLFRRLDRPVLTDLEVSFEGAEVTDLLPARLPDLFAGQPLVVAGRLHGSAPGHVVLSGRLGERAWSSRIAVSSTAGAAGEEPVAGTLWARRRIDELVTARPSAPPPEAVEAVVQAALRFKLVTQYTSFVAVERELRVDPALPLTRALAPNALPEGVSPEGIFGPPTSIQVLPARVKPGDPELRVVAPPGAVSVEVALPFEARPREAIRDPARGDFVLRFLVPSGWPEGSYDARIAITYAGGAREERLAPIRVDRSAAPVAVVSAPGTARPGETIRVALKPALPVGHAAAFLGRPGGLGNALKGAMEVKEILVRAPWGEVARARMEGPLGVYVAVLRVPNEVEAGPAELEVAASDAAGNVSRRRVALEVRPGTTRLPFAEAGVLALALAGGPVLVLVLAAGAILRRRRGPRPLALTLLAGSVWRADRPRAGCLGRKP
jgi:Ca-activated chloride channel family protein